MATEARKQQVARMVFWIGVIGDGLIALEWFWIAATGAAWPLLPGFFVGHGPDYQYAVGVGAIFMLAWTAVLLWGAFKPLERRGLLLLTALFLALAMLLEVLAARVLIEGRLSGGQLAMGLLIKLYLVLQFSVAFWYSRAP